MRLELNSAVYSDLVEIMEYYDEESGAELAAAFYAEFRRSAKLAASRPYSFTNMENGLRRVNLTRFPHHLLFKILDGSVRVLVVKHDQRIPSFGLDRE